MQVHCQTINENLAQTKEKVDQYLRDSEYHNSQIANLQQQQAAILTDKDHVMEQNVQLSATLSELQRTVQELEAQKDQLEHDKYSAQTSLEQLEAEHKKVNRKRGRFSNKKALYCAAKLTLKSSQ